MVEVEDCHQRPFLDSLFWRRDLVPAILTARDNCPHFVRWFLLLCRRCQRGQRQPACAQVTHQDKQKCCLGSSHLGLWQVSGCTVAL